MNIERQLMDDPKRLPADAEVLSTTAWLLCLKSGAVNCYDGSGYFSAGDYMDRSSPVFDNNGNPSKIPSWATAVAWFNK